MSVPPPWLDGVGEVKAMKLPSGDHAGDPAAPVFVRGVGPVPSGLTVQMSQCSTVSMPTGQSEYAIFPFLPGKAAWAGAASTKATRLAATSAVLRRPTS